MLWLTGLCYCPEPAAKIGSGTDDRAGGLGSRRGVLMRTRSWLITLTVLAGVAAAGFATRDRWAPAGAVAQAPPSQPPAARAIPVEVAIATRKSMPVSVEALGTVTPFAGVAIKARLETEIVGVHFKDGAEVKQGD